MLAWVCCSAVWALAAFGAWWVVLPAIVLVCASFTVSIVQDLKRM
jgi:hypothetical protein